MYIKNVRRIRGDDSGSGVCSTRSIPFAFLGMDTERYSKGGECRSIPIPNVVERSRDGGISQRSGAYDRLKASAEANGSKTRGGGGAALGMLLMD